MRLLLWNIFPSARIILPGGMKRDRRLLLSGQSAEGVAETGPIVCACYSVGLEAIRRAVAEGGAANLADVGRTLRAGTNCGSCIPELQGIIKRTAPAVGSRTLSLR